MLILALSIFIIPFLAHAIAVDPVIVSSKTDALSSQVASSHVVLESDDLEGTVSATVIDSIRNIPGIYINQTGGPGSQASIYIRGSEVRHVLVLIDGIKVNDPSNPDKQFNAANLSSLDIEKVEVLKGAQSVLYGSDAIGGVINIITKKGEPRKNIGLQLGFQNQIDAGASHYSQNSITHVNAYVAHSEGISAKKDGDELDGYQKQGITLNYSRQLQEMEASWMYKAMKDHVEDDGYDSSYKFVDDKEAYSKSLQQIGKQTLKFKNAKHTFGLNKTHREVYYYDTNKNKYVTTKYDGQLISQDFNIQKKLRRVELLFGLSHEYESFSKTQIDAKKNNLYSAYFLLSHPFRKYFFNLGLRNDYHERFQNIATYNIGLGKKIDEERQLKLQYGTGFKAPSLYQLYVPYDGSYKVGNEDLKPEKSQTLDLTYTQSELEITYFNNFIYDYFHYGSDGYTNKGSFHSQGIELSLKQNYERWSLKEGATLSSFHLSGKDHVLRRPQEKVDIRLDYQIEDMQSVFANWSWIGNRFDQTQGKDVGLEAYDLLNLGYQYKNVETEYELGVNNVFNREYTEIYGYSTLGLTVYGKLNYLY